MYFGAAVITVIYQEMGLSLKLVILLSVMLSLFNAIAEVPLGYAADRFGIRRAMVVGGLLATHMSPLAPIQVQPVTFVLSLAATLLIPTTLKHVVTQHAAFGRGIMCVLHTLFVQRADVRRFLLFDALLHASMLAVAWLVQPDMEAAGVALALFSVIFLAQPLLSYVLTFVKVHPENYGALQLLLLVCTSMGVGTAAISTTGAMGAVAMYLAIALHSAYAGQLMANVINSVEEVALHRTAAQSVGSALRALMFVPVFLLGALAESTSTDIALTVLAIIMMVGGSVFLSLQESCSAHRYVAQVRAKL